MLESCWDLTLFLLLLLTARGHGKGMALVDMAGTGSPSQGLLVAPAKSLWSDTPAWLRGLGGLGREQHPAGCKSELSLLGKPGLFPTPAEVGTGCVVTSVV